MRSFIYHTLLHTLLGASSVFAAVPLSSVEHASNLAVIPNKVILEVDTLAAIPNKRAFARSLDVVYDSIRARDVQFDIDREYESPGLFEGAVITVNNTADAVKLENIQGIKAIYPVRKFPRPQPVSSRPVSGPDDPTAIPDTFSTHVATGVDKVHARGLFGKGVKIGIIDTGIDYTHPLLGGAIGPGHKVVGGYDFVGDSFTGNNTPVPDNDPLDQCAGHGTHVAGIIAADPNNPYNISGVAYEASISAYRIFGCEGFTTDDIIIEALLRGKQDGQNVLNLSLGGASGWSSSASSVVASRVAQCGIVVSIAAGNDGAEGSWYTSSPGDGVDVISVASVQNTVLPSRQIIVTGVDHAPITYFSFNPLQIAGELPIYATSTDTTIPNDACNPLPDSTPDLSPFVVIVRRGTCTFNQKISNIQAKGAKAALVYDNGMGATAVNIPGFPISLIGAADGQFLVEQFIAKAAIKLSFPQGDGVVNIPDPQGGLVSTFSTYGPSDDFYFKPAIAAPGGNILSLLPTTQGSFGVLSGTSMATPFISGSAALLLEAKGISVQVAREARTIFQTTARGVPASNQDGALPQTAIQQGAGLVNVYDALFSTTSVSAGQIILNDTANYRPVQTFVVKNNDKKLKTYSVTHIPAGTALTVQENSIVTSLGPVPQVAAPAHVLITPSKFTLLPGQSIIVNTLFSPPSGLNASRYPLYSGFIQVSGPGENHHVTYIGLGASLKKKQVVDNTDAYFGEKLPLLANSTGKTQTQATNYTFVGNNFPTFVYRLVFGSPLVRLDLVEPDTKVQTTLNARGHYHAGRSAGRGHLFTFPQRPGPGSLSQTKVLGPLYEVDFVSRNDENTDNGYNSFALNSPKFANGSLIRNGPYRFLFRALKVTGDRSKQEDYETWLSPIVGIQA